MRKPLLGILLSAYSGLACGQAYVPVLDGRDTIVHSYRSSFAEKSDHLNSRIDYFQQRTESILNPDLSSEAISQRIRSMTSWIDSMRAVRYTDSLGNNVKHHIDSLARTVSAYKHKLDSLVSAGLGIYQDKSSTVERTADELHLSLPGTSGIDQATDLAYDFSDASMDLSAATSPATDVVKGHWSDLNNEADQLREIPEHYLDKVRSAEEVQVVQGKVAKANEVIDKAQAYEQDVINIASGDLDGVKEIPKVIESRVARMDGVAGLEEYQGEINQYKEMISQGNDLKAVSVVAVRYAVDHFAGHQKALANAMDKMTNVNSKMPPASSQQEMFRRSSNSMKDKKVTERIIPGVSFQVQKATTFLLDLNPSVAWRFTNRLSTGAGWNERISFSDWNQVVMLDRIFGPRAFTTFDLYRGFSVKAEVERMNVFIPSFYGTMDGSRGWVWSVFGGIKKDYTFYHRLKGNFQVLYNFYDDHDHSPYLDRVNVRMGFELR